jgi:serine/threonine-protein kinase
MEPKPLTYQFFDVRVDLNSFKVFKGDRAVHLEPKAFEVLVFLIENRGRLIGKQELLDAVWKGAFVTENAMTRVIAQLRKALGDDSKEAKYIETAPTLGYRFIPDVEVKARDETYGLERTEPENVAGPSETSQPALSAPTTVDSPDSLTHRGTKGHGRLASSPTRALAACAMAVGLAGFSYFWILKKPSAPSNSGAIRSIAVLPFKPLVAESRDESLEMGMADTLITKLSSIKQIIVRPISAVRKYSGPDQDPLAAGREQKVDLVLEGSLQKSNDKIRVTARLWSVPDGKTIWADKCDQQCSDIFAVQDSIAERLTQALALKIGDQVKNRLTRHYTENAEVYRLYLLGRFHYGKHTEEGFRKAIEYYEQAITKEPNYAPAFAGISYCYQWLCLYGFLTPSEGMPKASAAAARALAIDSDLADSHHALAGLKFGYDWDFTGAEREFKQALELDPNDAEAHVNYAELLEVMGRSAEAVAEGNRALELDPLSLEVNFNVGWTFLCTGQYDRADELARRLIELEPKIPAGHALLGLEFWKKGRYDQAVSELETSVALGGSPPTIGYLGCLYGIVGEREKAQRVLAQLRELSAKRYVLPGTIGQVYAGLGEMDRAFEFFEQAYEQRVPGSLTLKCRADLVPGLSADPRFADLLRRIGLPQ